MFKRVFIILWFITLGVHGEVPASLRTFLQDTCYECHDGDVQKGDLDLTALRFDLQEVRSYQAWVTIHDRVESGEMPPAKKPRPDPGAVASFTTDLAQRITGIDRARIADEGRATRRRMNRYEYEQTLRDLLSLPYLEVKDFLPEDSEAYGYNKIGDALDVSHVQMSRYLAAAEFALRSATAPQVERPPSMRKRFYAWDQRGISGKLNLGGPLVRRTFPIIRWDLQNEIVKQRRMPDRRDVPKAERDQEAMVVLVSSYEPTELRYSDFTAPVAGKYRLRFSGYSVWMGKKYQAVSKQERHEPIVIYSELPPRKVRKLGSFDLGPEPTERELEVFLLEGETIRPDAARLHRSRPPHHKNPDETATGMPGVAFQWMDVEGPLLEAWPPPGHRLLFGDLPVQAASERVAVESADPVADSARLLKRFMYRVYRRVPDPAEVERFHALVRDALAGGHAFTDALLAGYTAVLSSPAFLYFEERPGALDDTALAARLSYFMWNSEPDVTLRRLAMEKKLRAPEVLRAQTERLLSDPRARDFVNAFLDYWLDLRLIAGTAPDAELYPDYQLDDLLVESMVEETQLFFLELLKKNHPARSLVDADFAMLNGRLARHYGIPEVHGVHLRPVALHEQNNPTARGGLMTQASVLKVTANGTTTSPVMRGAWIMGRMLGKPPPPPPASVPAVEPDTRGATTIREQLAKHRSDETCNACHRKIDPPGFALESFDVMGGWRERYRSLGQGEPVKGIGHNGIYYRFKRGLPVDASGSMPDGFAFNRVHELKAHLGKNDQVLANNLASQLAVYATGAPIGFADRGEIAKIVENTRPTRYGIRSLIHELVQSSLFTHK